MNKPALIVGELSNERQDPDQLGIFQAELQQVERQLKTVDHQQHQLLQLAVKGFPEGQVEAENTRLNKARETLQAHKGELERQIKTRQTAVINMPKLEHTIELLQQRLKDPDFATKRDFMVKMWTSPRSPESGNGLGRSLKDVRGTNRLIPSIRERISGKKGYSMSMRWMKSPNEKLWYQYPKATSNIG